MIIEILGSGCPKCTKTYELARQAVTNTGADAEITKITDIQTITNYGVMITPALAINGEVKIAGRIPKLEDIQKWIMEEK